MPAVHLDRTADREIAKIARYIGIEKQSLQEARRFIDELHQKLAQYARQPEMGEPRSELGEALRSFTFKKNYVVIYRSLQGGIDVLHVVHGARDYPRLLGGQ